MPQAKKKEIRRITLSLRTERRHLGTAPGWFHKRYSGQGGTTPEVFGLLLESDVANTDFVLLESDTGTGTNIILLESSS